MRWPNGGLRAPADLPQLTQVQDVFPTLLELAGLPTPAGVEFDGKSLAPLLRDERAEFPDRTLFINFSRMPLPNRAPPGTDPAELPTIRPQDAAVLWKRWRWLRDTELYDLASDPMQEKNVAAENPELVADLRARVATWWARHAAIANEPQSIVIGHDAENPTLLSACEWWHVFMDLQTQVRSGEPRHSFWHIEVAQPATYEIALRRWPVESGLALRAAAPAAQLTDGTLPEGRAFPIAGARLTLGENSQELAVGETDEAAVFRVTLPAGRTTMRGVFLDAAGAPLVGAYYAYVRRLDG
jgi:arylsulfatase